MTLYQITVYHNDESRFMPYEDGHRLTATVSHWRDMPANAEPEVLADVVYHIYNADLDHLERTRSAPDGELSFLAACVYRLLRYRSLSTGDVIAVTSEGQTTWLACEFSGWRTIPTPANLTGQPITAEAVYHRVRRALNT